MVTVNVSDLRPNYEGQKYTLDVVNSSITVQELKVMVAKKAKGAAAENMLLTCGRKLMDDAKAVDTYNKSKRTKITVEMFLREDCKVHCKTLQACKTGGFVCVPLWGCCCRQTITVVVATHQTVKELKKAIMSEVGEDNRVKYENLQLIIGNKSLDNDNAPLSDYNIKDGSIVTMFVPCCWFKKTIAKKTAGDNESEQREGDSVKEAADKDDPSDKNVASDKE